MWQKRRFNQPLHVHKAEARRQNPDDMLRGSQIRILDLRIGQQGRICGAQ